MPHLNKAHFSRAVSESESEDDMSDHVSGDESDDDEPPPCVI